MTAVQLAIPIVDVADEDVRTFAPIPTLTAVPDSPEQPSLPTTSTPGPAPILRPIPAAPHPENPSALAETRLPLIQTAPMLVSPESGVAHPGSGLAEVEPALDSNTCQLRPGIVVVRLPNATVQVGSTPEHSLVFDQLAAAEMEWFEQLRRSGEPVPITSKREAEFASRLAAHELLREETRQFENLRISIRGLSPMGIELALALARSGIKRLDVKDGRPVSQAMDAWFPPHLLGLPRAKALREIIAADFPEVRMGALGVPDLSIVVGGSVTDLGVVGRLLSADIVHLPLTVNDRSINIGPLVIPGQTACSVCVEHSLMEVHPDWLAVRQACEKTEQPEVSRHLLSAGAAFTVQMIEQLVKGQPLAPGRQPMSASASVSWRVFERGMETTVWHPHPSCLCCALESAGG